MSTLTIIRMIGRKLLCILLLALAGAVNAQFGNIFEQFMGGQQQQQQAPQNVASDSAWYQQTYSQGRPPNIPLLSASVINPQ